MITVTVYQNQDGRYTGLYCIGHAGFADPGSDIVCAAVSVLVINTLNAIEAFTEQTFESQTDQETGMIDIRFRQPAGHDSGLLLDTMVLGLRSIQDKYGTDYILLTCKEV